MASGSPGRSPPTTGRIDVRGSYDREQPVGPHDAGHRRVLDDDGVTRPSDRADRRPSSSRMSAPIASRRRRRRPSARARVRGSTQAASAGDSRPASGVEQRLEPERGVGDDADVDAGGSGRSTPGSTSMWISAPGIDSAHLQVAGELEARADGEHHVGVGDHRVERRLVAVGAERQRMVLGDRSRGPRPRSAPAHRVARPAATSAGAAPPDTTPPPAQINGRVGAGQHARRRGRSRARRGAGATGVADASATSTSPSRVLQVDRDLDRAGPRPAGQHVAGDAHDDRRRSSPRWSTGSARRVTVRSISSWRSASWIVLAALAEPARLGLAGDHQHPRRGVVGLEQRRPSRWPRPARCS